MFMGKRLKELRESKKMYQEDLGKVIGLSKQTISFYESGDRAPNRDKVKKLCEYFNVEEGYFYGEEKEKDKVRELIDNLLANGFIKDPDHIPEEVVGMIMDAVKMDVRLRNLKKAKEQD